MTDLPPVDEGTVRAPQLAPRPSRRSRRSPAAAWARLERGDRSAVVLLLGIPAVVLVLPALFGHPVLAGDNQIQNYPLRVLTGQMLRAGNLPLWDQWIWSGSPLLSGLNAGSFYPGTLAYVILPGLVAWTINLVVIYWLAGIGAFLLARIYGLGSLASVLGAVSFAFAGSMTAQMVHLGIVQGAAWIPWMLLGELKLAQIFVPGAAMDPADATGNAPQWRRALPWVLVTGICGGLVILAGEPRSMTDAAVVCAVCPIWWLTRRRRAGHPPMQRPRFIAAITSAAVIAVALGGAQLLPGIRFLQTTQRSGTGLSYFATGSFSPRWSALLVVPDVFGGDGILHQPQYFSTFNLPEVTGYAGLLACVAAFTLLARSIGHNRSPEARTWSTYIALVVVGLLLSFGTFTPLGGPLSHIPFYGGERDQARNLAIVDLGLAMLLAFWVETRIQDRRAPGAVRRSRKNGAILNEWPDLLGLAPAIAAALICIALIAFPTGVERAFGISASVAGDARGLWPWALLQLGVALAVIALVARWPKLGELHATRWLSVIFAADLIFFAVACSTGFVAGRGVPLLPVKSEAAVLGTGRFAIYDPQVVNLPGLIKLGETDLNALTGHESVQGYGSAVAKLYNDATGTHLDGTFSPCAFEGGTFEDFGLTTILAIPGSVTPTVSSGPPTSAPSTPTSKTPSITASSKTPSGSKACGIDWPAATTTSRSWLLERPAPVRLVNLVVTHNGPVESQLAASTVRVGVIDSEGTTVFPVVASRTPTSRGVTVQFSSPVTATGIVVSGQGAGRVDDQTSVVGVNLDVTLDGALQDGLDRGGWHYAGTVAGFSRYVRDTSPRSVWIEPRNSASSAATVRRLSTTQEGGERDIVSAPGSIVVERSVAYAKGWHVEATDLSTRTSVSLPVVAVGLLQGVALKPGRYRITWTYWAPGLTTGFVMTTFGVVVVVAATVVWAVYDRRRRAVGAPEAHSAQGSG